MSVAVNATYTSVKTVAVDRSNYWRYYGLRRDPFVPGTRENEFYLSPRWEQSFDLIHYLCQEANVLLTVVGSKGCGKTTFLRHFIDHFGDNLRVCQLAASANLDVAGLLAAMTRDFALPEAAGETLEEQLDTQLSQLQYSRELCLITIDSAHRLADETLQALLYLIAQQSENQMRLHILLLGEESLKKRLSTLAAQSGEKELCHDIVLEPFDLAETKNYLTQRMAAAGLPAALPLSATSIARIHAQAEGVPARINAVARQVLVDSVSQRRFDSLFNFLSARKTLFIGATVLLVILLVAAMFLGRGKHYPLSFITPAKASDVVKTMPMPRVATNDANVPLMPTPVEVAAVSTDLTQPEVVGNNQEIVVGQSTVTVENNNDNNDASAAAAVTAPTPPPAPVVTHVTKQIPAVTHHLLVQAGNNKVAAKKPQLISKSHALVKVIHDNYTIQLIGGGNKSAITNFIKKHDLQSNEIQVVHAQYKGLDWYRLDYGHYATEEEAIKAIKQLPADLQGAHPWVKKINA